MAQDRIVTKSDLDESSPVPLYQQLEEAILARIAEGTLAVGDTLPPETSLSADLGLSRGTIRRAMADLVESGHIVRRAGRGSVVTEPPVSRTMDQLLDFTSDMAAQGLEAGASVLRFETAEPDEQVARALKLAPKERVFRIDRVRRAAGIPRSLERVQIPTRLKPDLSAEDLEGALYPLLAEASGSVPSTAEETYEAVRLGRGDAELLGEKAGAPAFKVIRIAFDELGRGFEYSTMLIPGDRAKYHLTLHADGSMARRTLPA